LVSGLNQQTKDALQQANKLFEEKLSFILNKYPAGKKNTFFKIKYGMPVTKVEKILLKDIFKLLAIDTQQIKHYQLIESMYLSGKQVDAKERARNNFPKF
jgi:hypothetical protein